MKKISLWMLTLLLAITLFGCPPVNMEEPTYLKDNHFDYQIQMKVVQTYQYQSSYVIRLRVEHLATDLSSFALTSHTLNINRVVIFGIALPEMTYLEDTFYYIDQTLENLEEGHAFYIEIDIDPKSVKNHFQEDTYFGEPIELHHIKVLINFNQDSFDHKIHNFVLPIFEHSFTESPMSFLLSSLDEIKTFQSFYEIDLPYQNGAFLMITPEISYVDDYEAFMHIPSKFFDLYVRQSDHPGVTLAEKSIYKYQDCTYNIYKLNPNTYSIEFEKTDQDRTIQYVYYVKLTYQEVLSFIESLRTYRFT